jgi:hypothetical protein
MALFKIISLPRGQIGVWQLTESLADLMSCFSSDELGNSDFRKYSFEKRKIEWLATRVLLKKIIGSEFSVTYAETGKPVLSHDKYKYLSISHSQNFVAVYLHEDCDVGIDLESKVRNYYAIEKRYLSASELEQTGGNPVLQCLYWCAKEAIFKMVPYEGLEFREHIHIRPFNPEQNDRFSGSFNYGNETIDYQLNFQIFENHCMVWVSC